MDAAWSGGRETVVTKHWKVMSSFLFGDLMKHEQASQTDERFKDRHNKEETERSTVIGRLPPL